MYRVLELGEVRRVGGMGVRDGAGLVPPIIFTTMVFMQATSR